MSVFVRRLPLPTNAMADDTPTTQTSETTDDQSTSESPPVAALAQYATPLSTTDPEAPLAPLEPLHGRLADARVVGLGEATHGSREFFQLKHRFVRYLVSELGVRAFALEANFSETLALDDYVVHGDGDPRDALDGVYFWTWNVESVLALVEWLRGFNEGRPLDERVRFFGVDAQYTRGPVEALREFFADADPAFLDSIRADLEAADDGGTPSQQEDARDAIATAADAAASRVLRRLNDRHGEYVSVTDAERVALARRHARVLEQAAEYKRTHPGADPDRDALERWLAVRDHSMAANVGWILDRPGVDRVTLWAHDAHVNRTRQPSDPPAPSLGSVLADRHGDAYFAVGFAFGRGAFQAIDRGPDTDDDGSGPVEHSLSAPLSGTIESTLAELGEPPVLVDLRAAAGDDALADWLDAPRPHFSVGATFDPTSPGEYLVEYNYADAFDAVCYVDETTRTQPLETG
jgi:erythromycin esterase